MTCALKTPHEFVFDVIESSRWFTERTQRRSSSGEENRQWDKGTPGGNQWRLRRGRAASVSKFRPKFRQVRACPDRCTGRGHLKDRVGLQSLSRDRVNILKVNSFVLIIKEARDPRCLRGLGIKDAQSVVWWKNNNRTEMINQWF